MVTKLSEKILLQAIFKLFIPVKYSWPEFLLVNIAEKAGYTLVLEQ